jgi:hypothetical protein
MVISGLSKMLLPRRSDATQRKHAFAVAESIAKSLCDHLTWTRVPRDLSLIQFQYLDIATSVIHASLTDGKHFLFDSKVNIFQIGIAIGC